MLLYRSMQDAGDIGQDWLGAKMFEDLGSDVALEAADDLGLLPSIQRP